MHALVVRQLRHLDTLFGKQSAFVFAKSSKSANNSMEKKAPAKQGRRRSDTLCVVRLPRP